MTVRVRRTLAQGGVANTERVDSKFHFVDNEKFYNDIKNYLILREQCVEEGKEIPQVPDSIGKVFRDIAEYESRKHNFANYSYIDEMKSDAVTNMCNYIHKFDWRKYDNPFAYFKQSCFYSFLLVIKKEKKETLAKAKIANSLGTLLDDIAKELQDEDSSYVNSSTELLQLRSSEILLAHEQSVKEKKARKEAKNIEDLMDGTPIESEDQEAEILESLDRTDE